MKWRWMVVFPLAFVACALLSRAQSPALEEGVRLFREGNFEQALVKLEQAHRMAPRNATIENLLGITETKLGHIDEACNHYRNAIRLDPSQAAPHKNLGFNLLNLKDYARAEPELRTAARLDPNDSFTHYYLLLLMLATSRDNEAVEQASGAGHLIDNDPEAGAGLIEAEIRTGHVEEASGGIRRLEDAGQLPAAREYSIAVLLSQHALYSQAVHCFQRIAALNPSWENRYNLALALLYAGQPAEAATLLASLHTERPAHADTLMFLGSAFEMRQQMPAALEAYRAALAADPANPDRTLDYTRLLMDLGRYDEAIQVVQESMEKTSSATPLELRLGAVEMIKGNYEAARDAFHAVLAADPRLDAAYIGLAQTYARETNGIEALRILEAARDKLPDHYLLEYYFGLLASRLGREQEAILAFEKAAQLEPKFLDSFYELGKLYESKQDWPRACQTFEHIIALNPQSAPAHYQLSRTYAHLGLTAKAGQEARQSHALVDSQRNQALRKQSERAASFEPPPSAAPAPQP